MPVSPNKGCRSVWWSGSATKWTAHKGTRSTFPRKSSRDSTRGGKKPWGGGVYVAETKTGGGQFSRKRNEFLRFLPSDSRKGRKIRSVARSKLSPGNIFKFPPSTELYCSNEIFQERPIRRNSLYESGKTLETSKLVIDFSFTWVIVSSREVYCTRSYLAPFRGCLSNRLAGSRSWLHEHSNDCTSLHRAELSCLPVEYRAAIKSQRDNFSLPSLPSFESLPTTMILGEKREKKREKNLFVNGQLHTRTRFSRSLCGDGRRVNQDFNIPPLHRLRTSYRLFPVNDVIVSAG